MSTGDSNACELRRAYERVSELERERSRMIVLVRDTVLTAYVELLRASQLGTPETSPVVAAMRAAVHA